MSREFKILLIILAVVVLLTFTAYKAVPILSAKQAFQQALNSYDKSIVENCERIYRLETGNFLSGQYTSSYSPGMEPSTGISSYPYGWNSLQAFWDSNTDYKPVGLTYLSQGTYIVFSSAEAGIMTVCEWLSNNNNVPALWFSTDVDALLPGSSIKYSDAIANITPSFTDET